MIDLIHVGITILPLPNPERPLLPLWFELKFTLLGSVLLIGFPTQPHASTLHEQGAKNFPPWRAVDTKQTFELIERLSENNIIDSTEYIFLIPNCIFAQISYSFEFVFWIHKAWIPSFHKRSQKAKSSLS